LPADVGRIHASINLTHEIVYAESVAGITYELAGTHGPSGVSGDTGNPRDRAMGTVAWTRGAATVATTVNFTGAFSITDPSAGEYTCVDALDASFTSAYGPRFLVSSVPNASFCKVHSFTDVDMHVSFAVNPHISLHGSMLDVFNRAPPLDLATYGGGGQLAYDPAFHQAGAVGRFFTLGVTCRL